MENWPVTGARMGFSIEQRERDGVTILALRGKLVLGDPVQELRTALLGLLQSAIEHGRNAVVLDCSDTSYIDSSGLGCLVMAHSRAVKVQGRLPIFGLNRRGLELMVITKLSTVFEIYDNEIDAINSCFADRKSRRFDVLDFVRSHNLGEPGQ
jgi:anti-sigma B factor antagonist